VRIVIVGAGLSGLTAARHLTTAGHHVTVVDKGRSVGGRLATRRIGGAVLDHGAQFFTVRTDEFAEQVERWRRDGLVGVWNEGFGDPGAAEGTDGDGGDGHPRYVGTRGMNALAKDLAVGLDVRCPAMVFGVRPGSSTPWEVVIDDGTVLACDATVLTCPLPQTFSLLFEVGVDVPRELFGDDYDRTIALLAVLDQPGAVPAPGGLQRDRLDGSIWTFVGDNVAKGVSTVPAITFHATPEWSEHHWDTDHATTEAALLVEARPFIGGATIVDHQVKRWRFATPRRVWPEPCWHDGDGRLVLAGDAFDGPRMEGAFRSGLAAARHLAQL
jgi:renalase